MGCNPLSTALRWNVNVLQWFMHSFLAASPGSCRLRHGNTVIVLYGRDVREVMVTLMMSPTRQQSIATRDCDVENKFVTIVSEDNVGNTWKRDDLPADPSTCTFWCAVAIGALAEGHPIESVAHYFRRAKAALASFTGPTNMEVAKAWTILGYLYAFSGDVEKFCDYLALSDSFIRDSAERGSRDSLPVGYAEVVEHGEATKLFTGRANSEEVESFLAQEISFPTISQVATEAQVSQFVLQSSVVTMNRALRKQGAGAGAAWAGGGDGEPSDDDASNIRGIGGGFGSALSRSAASDCASVMQSTMMGIMPDFGACEDAAERPNVRAGIGSLIINGALVFAKAVQGDSNAALEKLRRCVEIFDRYPGLSRFFMGEHIAHLSLSMVASMDHPSAYGLYGKLRNACNSTRPAGSLAIPPFEEWDGLSGICDNGLCRTTERLCSGRNLDFSSMVSSEGGAGTSGAEPVGGCDDRTRDDARQQHAEVVAHTVAQAAQVLASTPCHAHPADAGAQDEFIAAEDWLDVAHATLESP